MRDVYIGINMKKDDKKSNTFDCIKCGGTYSYKVDTFICPECNIYCLLRPTGGDKWPHLIELPCADCDGGCRLCEEENRLIEVLIKYLQV